MEIDTVITSENSVTHHLTHTMRVNSATTCVSRNVEQPVLQRGLYILMLDDIPNF